MKMFMYTLRDNVSCRFFAPSLESNDVAAMRSFGELVNGDPHWKNICKDVDLYRIGVFDLEEGDLTVSPRDFVCSGFDVLKKEGKDEQS